MAYLLKTLCIFNLSVNLNYVPKSDGEFYQFCYVTHAGDIRGASTPFQFRPATPTEELLTVTEDDCNSDILVVTTKTGMLEVRLTT